MIWVKLESAAVQLKLVEPFITSYFCECNLPLVPMRRQWVLEVCLESLFDLFFSWGSPQWQRNHPPQYRKCFLWGSMECQKKSTNPNLKSTHTKTTSGRIQKVSEELYFSRRRVRRGLIFRATLPPAQLERNAPFHKLNWGHAWHGNNREEVTISQILGVGVGKGELKLEQLNSFYPFPQRGEDICALHTLPCHVRNLVLSR